MFALVAAMTVIVVSGDPAARAQAPACKLTKLTYEPELLAVGQNGTVFFEDYVGEDNEKIPLGVAPCVHPSYILLKRTPTGSTSVIAGKIGDQGSPVPGKATASPFLGFAGADQAAVDSAGDFYFTTGDAVERITPQGRLSLVAGMNGRAGRPKPGPALRTPLSAGGIALDSYNNLYIADTDNGLVEKVTPQDQLSIIAGEPGKNGPPIPGPATHSPLNEPSAIATDRQGNVYVASLDGAGHKYAFGTQISKISPSGTLSVIAGNGVLGAPKLGVKAIDSPLGYITTMAVDQAGTLYAGTEHPLEPPVFSAFVDLVSGGTFARAKETVYSQNNTIPGCGRVEAIDGVAFGPDQDAYANTSHCVVRVTPHGRVTLIARTYSK